MIVINWLTYTCIIAKHVAMAVKWDIQKEMTKDVSNIKFWNLLIPECDVDTYYETTSPYS